MTEIETEVTSPSDEEEVADEQEIPEKESPDSIVSFFKELPVLVIVAFGIALLIKTFLLQAFYIPSGSMENTLLIKDRVLVAKFLYKVAEPKYGDVVVFISPVQGTNPKVDHGPIGNLFTGISEGLGLKSSESDFIKRVIATEGQTVQIKDGFVFVDNRKVNEPYRFDQRPMNDFPPTTIPKDKLWVMGDNRFNSSDSRVFGAIPKSTVVGRAFLLIWPLGRVTLLGV